ncbi:uncharacterized protein [Coffea arabica]|uniref:Uncharacterized protein LOC113698372 isoform X2 n=1 Tax=Coffea arabica TaxID=13443 RepID=A0A6P6T6Y9_COFAR|nr:uncharacterized protein LOC113698357 isoform X2 [Coffea arabica]XP_027073965.1 uncharacterized protein LOC113698357 isoform X2 [Coffea arabica]XP_027073990.1 uncharacterized protein LOC113698372 isoform X2 [Coffea arabica]XP_027073997.1 uncharacterized protein LOC113698372 isoform X2 [Coffea arabica]
MTTLISHSMTTLISPGAKQGLIPLAVVPVRKHLRFCNYFAAMAYCPNWDGDACDTSTEVQDMASSQEYFGSSSNWICSFLGSIGQHPCYGHWHRPCKKSWCSHHLQ